ncbi:MAG: hypothetical protein HKO59_12750 [Phycisphaerales bacterium]|nr:hypothetical protein [Phycisphaerae bacterium]NNM26832.1 hypothetical protein [Phycisphaerales bacterium]
MSTHPSPPRARFTPADPELRLTVPQLAHELNSLLDGSMRSLRQAERALDDAAGDGDHTDVRARLLRAETSLEAIAALLARAMGDAGGTPTLQGVVDQVIDELATRADAEGVTLGLSIDQAVADVPAAMLDVVIRNGLVNAIEACANAAGERRVELSALRQRAGTELTVLITDTGPGLPADPPRAGTTTKPGGHGLGLSVCDAVLDDLGGRWSLRNVPFGAGCIFSISVPVNRLR